MSDKKKIIEVQPPKYMGGSTTEMFHLNGFRCTKCSGRGWTMDYGLKEQTKVDCPVCDGSGELSCVVSIAWKSHIPALTS